MHAKLPLDAFSAEDGLLSETEGEGEDSDEDTYLAGQLHRLRHISKPRVVGCCTAGSLLLMAAWHLLPASRAVGAEAPHEIAKAGSQDGLEFRESAEIPDALGVVDGVYTYGAPGIANPPLEDLHRKDRCFQGLRSYTEDVLGPFTKQVDAAAMSNTYAHPKMGTAALHEGTDVNYPAGCGDSDRPNNQHGDTFQEWRLHWEEDYTPRLEHVSVNGSDATSQEPFSSARDFVFLAYKAYDSTNHTIEAISDRLPGWKLVARETRVSGSGSSYDEDPVALVQNQASLECALVFTGTNNPNELTTALDTVGSSYCGFADVHEGYQNELRWILKDLWPALRPKVSKCSKVSCVGHSMGGSLCELFAACANSGRVQDPDYQQQAWNRSAPEALGEITAGGVYWVPEAERRCAEPPCWKV